MKERVFLLAATLSLLLAACTGSAPATPQAGLPAPAVQVTTNAGAPAVEASAPTASSPTEAVAAATDAPLPAPTEAPPAQEPPPVPVKTGFVPTNPETVQLASGHPQLIEFFAFW